MGSKLFQILCSASDFLAHTQGGGSEWHRLPRRPEGQYQLEVFFCRSRAGASSYLPAPPPQVSVLQQKVAGCIEWIDEAKLSKYKKVIDLVQFWTTAAGGGDETMLSVSGQPFGVGRQLSNGVCRYRYDCISFIQKPCRDDGDGDPISAAFETGLIRYQHQLVDHLYGVQSRWALPVLERPTGKSIGVLEFVTVNDHRFEYHKLLTQTFLDFGPIYYEDNGQHFPMTENIIPDNSSWETTNAGYGPLENALEDPMVVPLFNHPTIWRGTEDEQVPAQEYMGGTNLSYGTILNVSCGNASEDHSRVVPTMWGGTEDEQVQVSTQEYMGGTNDQIDLISNLDDHQIFNDPTMWGGTEDEQVQVPTQEYMGGTNDQIDETLGISLSCGTMNVSCGPLGINAIEDPRYDKEDHTNSADRFVDPAVEELVQVPAQESMGGTNDQIEETPGMIQQPSSKSPYNDNNAVQRTSSAATCRKRKRPTRDQLRILAFSGKRQKDVADELKVHPATIKHWCRDCGIEKWPSSKMLNKATQNTSTLDTMSIKATYGTCNVKLKIDSTIEFESLCKELGEMFKLDVGTFTIHYREVDTDNLIMIPCTQELKRRFDSLNSSEKKTMHLEVSQAN